MANQAQPAANEILNLVAATVDWGFQVQPADPHNTLHNAMRDLLTLTQATHGHAILGTAHAILDVHIAPDAQVLQRLANLTDQLFPFVNHPITNEREVTWGRIVTLHATYANLARDLNANNHWTPQWREALRNALAHVHTTQLAPWVAQHGGVQGLVQFAAQMHQNGPGGPDGGDGGWMPVDIGTLLAAAIVVLQFLAVIGCMVMRTKN